MVVVPAGKLAQRKLASNVCVGQDRLFRKSLILVAPVVDSCPLLEAFVLALEESKGW